MVLLHQPAILLSNQVSTYKLFFLLEIIPKDALVACSFEKQKLNKALHDTWPTNP